MMITVFGEEVIGVAVDDKTRCAHYHSELDIIAIKFKCCGKWFPCYKCHSEIASHEPAAWEPDESSARAVLCGNCGEQLSISAYKACGSACPNCSARFNPGCESHYHLYFG